MCERGTPPSCRVHRRGGGSGHHGRVRSACTLHTFFSVLLFLSPLSKKAPCVRLPERRFGPSPHSLARPLSPWPLWVSLLLCLRPRSTQGNSLSLVLPVRRRQRWQFHARAHVYQWLSAHLRSVKKKKGTAAPTSTFMHARAYVYGRVCCAPCRAGLGPLIQSARRARGHAVVRLVLM